MGCSRAPSPLPLLLRVPPLPLPLRVPPLPLRAPPLLLLLLAVPACPPVASLVLLLSSAALLPYHHITHVLLPAGDRGAGGLIPGGATLVFEASLGCCWGAACACTPCTPAKRNCRCWASA